VTTYTPTFRQQLVAEGVGTALLLIIIVGSGIIVSRDGTGGIAALFPHAVAVGVGLGVLIHLLRPISGAQFNPAVTLCALASRLITPRQAAAYITVQTVGGIVGAYATDRLMRSEGFTFATNQRTGTDLFLSELFATTTLLVLIFLLVRDGRVTHLAGAVGGWILAAIMFTPSAAFANPVVSIARMFTDSYAGIAPGNVAGFVAAQLLAIPVALGLLLVLRPQKPSRTA
jgi:glycerol uptake facilitator-like aquaporin